MGRPGWTLVLVSFLLCTVGNPSAAVHPITLSPEESRIVSSGKVVIRRIPLPANGAWSYEAVGVLPAPPGRVYRVLTDFRAFPEFMPNLRRLRVLHESSGTATVNYVTRLPLGFIKKYRLRMTFSEDGDGGRIAWKMVPWPGVAPSRTFADVTGHWIVRPCPGDPGRTLLLYRVYTDPGYVPAGLRWIAGYLSRTSIPRMYSGTRDRLTALKP